MSHSTTTPAASYDEVPYPSYPTPRSHPDRLAAVAALFGMQPAAADRCRVLELGCASGGNLLPMAERLPQSSFLGIDFSHAQIDSGRRLVDEMGFPNVELRHADVRDLGDELGTFDYIIAHGLLSWVPRPVDQQILALCRRLLAEQGIAYVSYNAYPGWYIDSILREIVLRFAPSGSPQQRLGRARTALGFLSAAIARQRSPYAWLVKREVDTLLRQPDGYMYHDHFEEENHPLYFHEFVEQAGRHGLQYVSEPTLSAMFPSNFGPRVEELLAPFGDDRVAVEQHLDVLVERPFRQTLLCHQHVPLRQKISPERSHDVFVAAQLAPQSAEPDLATAAPEAFTSPKGLGVGSRAPAVKAALVALGKAWPQALSHGELLESAAQLSQSSIEAIPPGDRANLDETLVQLMIRGMAEFFSLPDSFVATASERPRAGRLARAQSLLSATVTNQRHSPVTLNPSTRVLLKLLDGEHDRAALESALAAAIERGDVEIPDIVAGDPAVIELPHMLQQSLDQLAQNALLIA